jgi:hypothetical protein
MEVPHERRAGENLGMREGWRELAKCARLEPYAVEDVGGNTCEASKQVWRIEKVSATAVPPKRILGDPRLGRLERLRSVMTGSPFGTVPVQYGVRVTNKECGGPQAPREAVKCAPLDRVLNQPTAFVETRLTRMLTRHSDEWTSYAESLGSRAFMRRWAQMPA